MHGGGSRRQRHAWEKGGWKPRRKRHDLEHLLKRVALVTWQEVKKNEKSQNWINIMQKQECTGGDDSKGKRNEKMEIEPPNCPFLPVEIIY